MHTDRCDTVGMFCLRRAKSGGESGYSSALAVHDRIREIKPVLLESIWNGFHLRRFGEQPPGEPLHTPIRIPVFSERDSVTTVILIGGYAWMVADEFDAPFSDRDREVLVTFERLAADPKIRVSFQLERGEAVLFNNCAVLHNRTAFEDHDEPNLKRHLMRLWLMDWDGRPTVEGVRYHKGEGGIVPQGARSRIMPAGIRRLTTRNDVGHRCEVHDRRPQFEAGKTRRRTSAKRHRVTRHNPRDWSRGFSGQCRCYGALERRCWSAWIDGDSLADTSL